MIYRALRVCALLLAAGLLLWGGLVLRAWVWEYTSPIRFIYDINNGYSWGNFASRVGYFNVYDEVGDPDGPRNIRRRDLDYAPLRLGVMSAWVNWTHTKYPDVQRREPSQAFHAPLLWFNTTIEALAAVATFLIVTLIMRPSRWRPWAALFGAALTWFNPIMLYNAHAWPQWDVWPMPFYLFALYAALHRQWLIGGMLIGIGSMLKGQLLMVGWTFPLWALLIGDWRGTLKFFIGLATALFLIAIVWELSIYLPGPGGFTAYGSTWTGPMRRIDWPAVVWVCSWVIAALLLPRRISPTYICLATTISLGSTYVLFNASSIWFKCGIILGTAHYPSMQLATTSNLTSILSMVYGYNDEYELMFEIAGATIPVIFFFIAWAAVWIVLSIKMRYRASTWLRGIALAILLPTSYFLALLSSNLALALLKPATRLIELIDWAGDVISRVVQAARISGPLHPTLFFALLLQRPFIVEHLEPIALPDTVPITMKTLLVSIYFSLSIWCVIWAAVYDVRRDARLLLAITTPWLLFYCIPPQIHERYLLFFSACVGLFVACGTRWLLLGAVLTVIGFVSTIHQVFQTTRTRVLTLRDPQHDLFSFSHYLVTGTFPGIAWLLLFIAIIFLYSLVGPRPWGDRKLLPAN